jgi:ectoine hydroxylase-related dioxygenase (phytanoyl-CoA dioxygenase family)
MGTLKEKGLVGPFLLEDLSFVEKVSQIILQGLSPLKDRHVDNELIRAIFFDNNVQTKVENHFGKDLRLWRSNFFLKKENSGEIGWHHDRHFENGDDLINFHNLNNHFSILIALTDICEGHGEIEYIPGSHLPDAKFHRDNRPFHKREPWEHYHQIPNDLLITAEPILLKKGEFALFHSGLLHHSKPFLEGNPRISMVGRLVKSSSTIPSALAPADAIIPFN